MAALHLSSSASNTAHCAWSDVDEKLPSKVCKPACQCTALDGQPALLNLKMSSFWFSLFSIDSI